jgi:hypothetical protein
MFYKLAIVALVSLSCQLYGKVDESCLPQMDQVYGQDFGKKVNLKQKEASKMLYNIKTKNFVL